jgi:thiamine transport system substrate-binding protein
MQHGIFSLSRRKALATTLLGTAIACANYASAAQELRVLTHSAFAVPKPLLTQFEKEAGVKLRISKAGDAGEMLNKLILTRKAPIADVVYGIDNTLAAKAIAADVLDAYNGPASQRAAAQTLPAPLVPVDYGYVTINYDVQWFAKRKMALPASLDDLTQPAMARLLVVQNPATSSTGYAFLLATIGAMGEEKAFDWWAHMRKGGVKVAKGWTEAYYTDFSRAAGGARPLVVSYATSPAAEVFYSKEKITESPTGSLVIPGAVYRQVEGIALVKGGGARVAADKLIEFMRSPEVQKQMQTEMWMYPVDATVARADVMKFAPEPAQADAPTEKDVADKGVAWVARWTKVVLK